MLNNDPDKQYLLHGIKHGFPIINFPNSPVDNVIMHNYSSALTEHDAVEAQILTEIKEGRYIVVNEKPQIVSALGAIPKPDGGIRLIHDCSRPYGRAINDFASINSKIKYQSVQHATNIISKSNGYYLAKLDLKHAYRSVKIDPNHYKYAGLSWHFKGHKEPTWLCDTRLPFGAKLSVECFHRISLAIQRILASQGIQTVIYLDDILIISHSHGECLKDLNHTIKTLRALGLSISYNKTEGPCRSLVFLGVRIDTVTHTLHLPDNKVKDTLQLLQQFQDSSRASLKQLQRLAGKLSWASHVVQGGRVYLQRVLDLMRPLKQAYHKVRLSQEFKADIQWWLRFLPSFNSTYFRRELTPTQLLVTDSCQLAGGATYNNNDWSYFDWKLDYPEILSEHINVKEAMTAILSTYRWAPQLANSKVILLTDNIFTRAMFNKGVCRNKLLMHHMRNLFWLANFYNFDIECHHIAGKDNVYSDAISRMRQRGHFLFWYSCISHAAFTINDFIQLVMHHMSYKSLSFFISQVKRLVPWWTN